MNLFIKGYVNANGIEAIARIIVIKLKLIKIKKAKQHKIIEYIDASFNETFPEAIGRFLVLSTFLSKSLSIMSFTMHPAERIRTEPKKNKTI